MAKVALVLSGCGYLDGSEIHESVLCLLELSLQGHSYYCFAPNKLQKKVVNHLVQEEVKSETRNTLVEAARIARGKIADLKQLKEKDFDAILFPGGFGVALNLSDFAEKSEYCEIEDDLKEIIRAFYKAKKPIAATCIAPVVIAKALEGVVSTQMTLGSDLTYQEILSKMGTEAKLASVKECVIDRKHKIYTTPCYMEKTDLIGIHEGIKKLIKELFL